ncbi:hypothetical protein DNTS_014893 [Danionella cerebrum]|uniref:GRF-type domain-containing protein n=1 Tax=Danionella cerebrum TaxID=2873325 RepID=A0A553RAZ1_9TELE|nr:hypothetical protein DNTS_014893 [Danionella translucida]
MGDATSDSIEVIIPNENDKTVPRCSHGPALLFERTRNVAQKGRRFYACSACRDRKDCNLFQWEDEKISEVRSLAREAQNSSKSPPFTHQEYSSRFLKFVSLPVEQRRFCVDCQLLILPGEWMNHAKHRALSENVSVQMLKRPSLLLSPLDNKKSNAQYLFADRSCNFLLDVLLGLGFQKFLCVGTPRLHERIKLRNAEGGSPIKSLLLDIDYRFCQFYGQDEFCRYNMFNHYFFDEQEAVTEFKAFLCEEGGAKVIMITDPPFGGLVKPLANSFSQISQTWKSVNDESEHVEMPIIWTFPYFFESRILEYFPSFSMLDYQVDYENHPLYKHGMTGRKQSPVRLFTNLSPKGVQLPADEGYRTDVNGDIVMNVVTVSSHHGVTVRLVVAVLFLITPVVRNKQAVSTVAATNTK